LRAHGQDNLRHFKIASGYKVVFSQSDLVRSLNQEVIYIYFRLKQTQKVSLTITELSVCKDPTWDSFLRFAIYPANLIKLLLKIVN